VEGEELPSEVSIFAEELRYKKITKGPPEMIGERISELHMIELNKPPSIQDWHEAKCML